MPSLRTQAPATVTRSVSSCGPRKSEPSRTFDCICHTSVGCAWCWCWACAAGTSLIPARRAAAVNPVVALRVESQMLFLPNSPAYWRRWCPPQLSMVGAKPESLMKRDSSLPPCLQFGELSNRGPASSARLSRTVAMTSLFVGRVFSWGERQGNYNSFRVNIHKTD